MTYPSDIFGFTTFLDVNTSGEISAAEGVIEVDKDGRGTTAFALSRYHADGSLNTDLGDKGMVVTPGSEPVGVGTAIAVDPDGKYIISFKTNTGNSTTLLRLNL